MEKKKIIHVDFFLFVLFVVSVSINVHLYRKCELVKSVAKHLLETSDDVEADIESLNANLEGAFYLTPLDD